MSQSTTRRAVLAGAAVAPALALPAVAMPNPPMTAGKAFARFQALDPEIKQFFYALAREDEAIARRLDAEPDPIFAAIEAHRVAQTKAESVWAIDDEDVSEPIFIAADEALGVVLATTPATLPGCIALLRHLAWWEQRGIGNEGYPFNGWSEKFSEPGSTLYGRLANTIERAAGKVQS